LAVAESAAADVQAFVERGAKPQLRFERVAVTADQVTRFNLLTAPQKAVALSGDDESHVVWRKAGHPLHGATISPG
jgi:hypothetical protein